MRARTWTIAGAGFIVAMLLVAFVAPRASSRPDGLEWTLEQAGPPDHIPDAHDRPVGAPLPDYTVPGVEREGPSTALAGLIGTAVVFAATYALTRLAGARRRRLAHGKGATE